MLHTSVISSGFLTRRVPLAPAGSSRPRPGKLSLRAFDKVLLRVCQSGRATVARMLFPVQTNLPSGLAATRQQHVGCSESEPPDFFMKSGRCGLDTRLRWRVPSNFRTSMNRNWLLMSCTNVLSSCVTTRMRVHQARYSHGNATSLCPSYNLCWITAALYRCHWIRLT